VATNEVTYAWEKDGVALEDGPTGTGSSIFGTHAFSMIVLSPSPSDAGVYRCVVSSVCEGPVSVTSDPANLTVCAADFNCDGSNDFFDYDDFAACFEGVLCPGGATPDFNRDGSVDFFDYNDFVIAFEEGC